MSYGLCCLTCRRHIGDGANAFFCQCDEPVPTWDLKSAAVDTKAYRAVQTMLFQRHKANTPSTGDEST